MRTTASVLLAFVLSSSFAHAADEYRGRAVVRVKDSGNRPVSGALVALRGLTNSFRGTSRTNSRGVAVFGDLREGRYRAQARKNELGSGSDEGVIKRGNGPWYANVKLGSDQPADLAAVSFRYAVTADAVNNGPIPVNARFVSHIQIKNLGKGSSTASSVSLHVSRDARISKSDARLAVANIPPLRPGSVHTVQLPAVLLSVMDSNRNGVLEVNEGMAGRVWIGLIVDPDNRVNEGTKEGNNANQGSNKDVLRVQLFDPIPRVYFRSGFRTRRQAVDYLTSLGFSESLPSTGGGYTQHLDPSNNFRSRFDGSVLPGLAFRRHGWPRSPGGEYRYYDVAAQRWTTKRFSKTKWTVVIQGDGTVAEPSPVYAGVVAGLFPDYGSYVSAWHARF